MWNRRTKVYRSVAHRDGHFNPDFTSDEVKAFRDNDPNFFVLDEERLHARTPLSAEHRGWGTYPNGRPRPSEAWFQARLTTVANRARGEEILRRLKASLEHGTPNRNLERKSLPWGLEAIGMVRLQDYDVIMSAAGDLNLL